MIDDPFASLADPDSDAYPMELAAKRFDPADPAPLLKLLGSDNPIVSGRGLSVFGWMGAKSFVALDFALALCGHPHEMARSALLDGVLCYPEKLNAAQIGPILTRARDPFPLVRDKLVTVLAYVDLAALDGAIDALQPPLRDEHRLGFETLVVEPADVQQLFDDAVARDDIWSLYAFAAICRLARSAILEPVPEYAGGNCVPEGVIHHVKMLNARKNCTRPAARGRVIPC